MGLTLLESMIILDSGLRLLAATLSTQAAHLWLGFFAYPSLLISETATMA